MGAHSLRADVTGRRHAVPGEALCDLPDLRFETMVSATEAFGVLARNAELPRELTMMWICCHSPISLAEIAALLGLTYDRVRELARDAVSDGLLHVYPDSCDSGQVPRLNVVARLRHGLSQLD
jgi:hypothetical protein